MSQRTRAFTLVEMVVVVLILGVLAIIAIPRITESSDTAKVNTCATNVKVINRQLEFYFLNNGSWPSTLTTLTQDTTYFPDGEPVCPFGTAYNYNTTIHHVEEHSH